MTGQEQDSGDPAPPSGSSPSVKPASGLEASPSIPIAGARPDFKKLANEFIQRGYEVHDQTLSDEEFEQRLVDDLAEFLEVIGAQGAAAGRVEGTLAWASWRPIEDAPKDGTYILATNTRSLNEAHIVAFGKFDLNGYMVAGWLGRGDETYHNPLYFDRWMPLPASPAILRN